MTSYQKLVVIGLDAADFDLVRALIDEGRLPYLKAIKEKGVFSLLPSTIPPQTAPAWTTITTGVNPGRHGIYYFHNFSTSPITITNATDTSTPRIWDYVGGVGGRSVVVNVPVTYPAQTINGAMVSGIPPWFFDAKSVFPADLHDKLKAGGYEIDAPMSRGLERQPDLLVERVVSTEKRRIQAFLELLKEGEWAFGMVVLTALDRLQHKLVGKGPKEDEAVRRCYQEIDGQVGRIMDALGSDVNYLVVSDHGYNARPMAFYPNALLREKGLLTTKGSFRNRLAVAAHDILDGHLLWLPQGITKRFQGAATVVRNIDAVDLEASRAFVPGTDGVLIARSKDDQDLLIAELSRLKDDTGKEVCKVYGRDQVYEGDRLSGAPDLLIVPRDDINIKTDPFSKSVLSREGSFPKGNHSSKGIFLAAGPGIRHTDAQVSIEDVAPTSLSLMGIRPPDSMEGRVLGGILISPDSGLVAPSVKAQDRRMAFSAEEEKNVLENLKRLGYA